MRTPRRLIVLVALAAWFGVSSTAEAATFFSQYGSVEWISDGDTFTFDPSGGSEYRVRHTGINATESGQCHSTAAERRLGQLIDGETVKVSARNEDLMSGNRYWRWVEAGGVDVSEQLLLEGLVVPFPHAQEWDRNFRYLRAATIAAREKAEGRLWDDDACGSGPEQDNGLKLWVQWDASGVEKDNVNGEYVRIRNYGSDPVDLGGWWLRDTGATNYYYFKSGQKIPARGYVTIHTGRGTDTATTWYWGYSAPIFGNPPPDDSIQYGDAALLFDPDGDIRTHQTYPCVYACARPLAGKIHMWANWTPGWNAPGSEWVKIKNISSGTVHLTNYLLESYPYVYDFGHDNARESSRLAPGETMKITIGRGNEWRLHRYWGLPGGILTNSGDTVQVRSFDRTRQKCIDWGWAEC